MPIGFALMVFAGCITIGSLIKEGMSSKKSPPLENPLKREPPRARNGQLIIQNRNLWLFDCKYYGAAQAHKWACEGKYNTPADEEESDTVQ